MRGRPKKAEEDKRTSKIELRVTAEELERYRQSAGDQPVSEFLRGLADLVIPPEAQEVPIPAPPIKCVYFLMKDGACIYVGQTRNLCQRLKCHVRAFDRVLAIPLAPEFLWETEQAYIEALEPEHNSLCGMPKPPFEQKEFLGPLRVTYRKIAELAGVRISTARNSATSGRYDPTSLEDVVRFIQWAREKRGLPPIDVLSALDSAEPVEALPAPDPVSQVTAGAPAPPAARSGGPPGGPHLASCRCQACYQLRRERRR
jgi:hypothetical protein